MAEGVEGGAEFEGPDDCYRIVLWRSWGDPGAPYALWIGCNPSTADGLTDDPTVAIEQGITRSLGLTQYIKINVSPWRATSPDSLKYATAPLEPPAHALLAATWAINAEKVILACGAVPDVLRPVAERMFDLIAWTGCELWCLGTTKDGSPRHPLYMPAGSPLARWYGWKDGLGPTHRFFAPDAKRVPPHQVGDAWAWPAQKPRRLRDLVFYQVCDGGVFMPAAHLATRYAAEVEAWAKRVSQ